MKVRTVGFREALAFAEGKTVEQEYSGWAPYEFEKATREQWDSVSGARFSDGTGLLVATRHDGPYSEVTPDIDYSTAIYICDGMA